MLRIQLKRKRKNYLCLSIIATSLLLCLSFVNRLKWREWKWLPAAAFEIRNHIQEISPSPDWIDFKTHYKKNKTLKPSALIWAYLFLWGQPVHLGAATVICLASREIRTKLKVQCWGYQTSPPGAGTSPALLTGGWTVRFETGIFPPAHGLWPNRERGGRE